MSPISSSKRARSVRWASIGTGLALAAFAVTLVATAQGEAVTRSEQTRLAQTKELNEARRTLEAASQDVVIVRMLDGASIDGDRRGRLASASTSVVDATRAIRAVAAGEGPVAVEARALLDDLDVDALDDPMGGDLDSFYGVAEDIARWAGSDNVISTRRDAIQQLSYIVSLPPHVMIEGIAADISVNGRSVDPSIRDAVQTIIGVVRTEGGWYGADASSPLSDSEWIEIDEASEMFPAAAQRLGEITASSSLISYDAWMRELGSSDTPPPVEVTEALGEADRLTAELATVIDELLAQEEVLEGAALTARESRRALLLGVASLAALLAIAAGTVAALSISRARRAARDRAQLAMRDALTGVGNRHELDARTRVLTSSPRFGHHVVAMIDLDRFKMVNDIYGHAAGDQMLIEIAARLEQAAARIVKDRPDVETSVIRLGGDEFLLTAHGGRPFDVDSIVADLASIRHAVVEFDGDRVDLAFSFGICSFDGQRDLADMMSAADLSAYDDKAARARERAADADRCLPRVSTT